MLKRFFAGLTILLLVFVVFLTGFDASAQDIVTGTRTASTGKEAGQIHLKFERRGSKGDNHQMDQNFALAELQGLSHEQVLRGGTVKFSPVREAGTIECEGSFQDGKGSGTFRFRGNQALLRQ